MKVGEQINGSQMLMKLQKKGSSNKK